LMEAATLNMNTRLLLIYRLCKLQVVWNESSRRRHECVYIMSTDHITILIA